MTSSHASQPVSASDSDQTAPRTLSVTELNRVAKDLLEIHLNNVHVEGEISNFSQPSSGHWYFTLKDENAQIRCAMFRNRNVLCRSAPKSGDHIRVRARVSLYEARGDYQLIVDHLEAAGAGALQQQFERLKQKLFAEGLFAPEHKKPLPEFPSQIAVITSATGAAFHDVLSVIAEHNPALTITLIPASVQGEDAPRQLMRALDLAQKAKAFDAIILTRGGGSIEDLWAFNDEKLARAIYECRIPVISAVGHEIDFTIADFVADARAPTPSAAAKLVAPDLEVWLGQIYSIEDSLSEAMQDIVDDKRQELDYLRSHLKHPKNKLEQIAQRLDSGELKLHKAVTKYFQNRQKDFNYAKSKLSLQRTRDRIYYLKTQLKDLNGRIKGASSATIKSKGLVLDKQATNLDIVSPLSTLKRGYSITTCDKRVLNCTDKLKIGDSIRTTLAEGAIDSKIEKIIGR